MIILRDQAIQTALTGDWKQAISINQVLLKEDPGDIETLNRLGFAFAALGKIKNAKDIYQKVLKLDSNNPIALRNLKRLSDIKRGNILANGNSAKSLNNIFLEETGKTKVIELVNIAQPKVVSLLQTGEALTLSIKRLKVFVLGRNNQYIGMLPDNIGKRLIEFLKGGNYYESYVRAIKNHKVNIFIKEAKRAKKFKNQPSFVGGTTRKAEKIQKTRVDYREEEAYSISSGFSEIEEEF